MVLEALTQTDWLDALEAGNLNVVNSGLEQGFSVNTPVRNRQGRYLPPLHYAIANRRLGVVRFLLDNGADVNAIDDSGTTALLLAKKIGNPFVLGILVDKKISEWQYKGTV